MGDLPLSATDDVDVSDRPARQLGRVTVEASQLAEGAATEATLSAAKADLDALAERTPPLGQATMSASRPVVLASDQRVPTLAVKDIDATIGTAPRAISASAADVDVSTYRHVGAIIDVAIVGPGSTLVVVLDEREPQTGKYAEVARTSIIKDPGTYRIPPQLVAATVARLRWEITGALPITFTPTLLKLS